MKKDNSGRNVRLFVSIIVLILVLSVTSFYTFYFNLNDEAIVNRHTIHAIVDFVVSLSSILLGYWAIKLLNLSNVGLAEGSLYRGMKKPLYGNFDSDDKFLALITRSIYRLANYGIPITIKIKLLPQRRRFLFTLFNELSPVADLIGLISLASATPRIPNLLFEITEDEKMTRLSFHDTQNWVSNELISSIWTPTFSLGNRQDLGKELILTKNKIEDLNGTIVIGSSETMGTKIEITVPNPD